jgi:hypothetical protein
LQETRAWLDLKSQRVLKIPLRLAAGLGRLGDLLRLGPISATSVVQLEQGIFADPTALSQRIPTRPRGFRSFLVASLAGTQDLWQARLYLLKPLIRLSLALMWIASAAIGLLLPAGQFLPAGSAMSAPLALFVARGGGVADALLALALLRNWQPKGHSCGAIAVGRRLYHWAFGHFCGPLVRPLWRFAKKPARSGAYTGSHGPDR